MKGAKRNTKKSVQATGTKASKKLMNPEEAPFFSKKMEKANKILAMAPLPR
jgi:hypothetical protein